MKKIGFIGVGVMGKSMVRNLHKNGYELAIYTRTKSKAEDLLREGITWCDSVAECAANRDVVITMVGFPKDVEEVYFGAQGILENAQAGGCVIDMTTTDPSLACRIYEEAKKKGIYALDAPVSGGDVGAKEGTLTIMAGGDKAVFDVCRPLLETMGKTVVLQGSAGAGQHTKMANQIALGGAIAGVCEAIAYVRKQGLNPNTVLKTLSNGAAGSWQMSNTGPRIVQGDYAPGFYVKHYNKDLGIAQAQAKQAGLDLKMLECVCSLYQHLEEGGFGDLGTQALIKEYET